MSLVRADGDVTVVLPTCAEPVIVYESAKDAPSVLTTVCDPVKLACCPGSRTTGLVVDGLTIVTVSPVLFGTTLNDPAIQPVLVKVVLVVTVEPSVVVPEVGDRYVEVFTVGCSRICGTTGRVPVPP
jgi:hypothetical protein